MNEKPLDLEIAIIHRMPPIPKRMIRLISLDELSHSQKPLTFINKKQKENKWKLEVLLLVSMY